ncbi:PIN domain-containing protein [candidate division KSB1 bacterium]|nr:PIN domain-containing protein [candidate division KSB1 bacterium]
MSPSENKEKRLHLIDGLPIKQQPLQPDMAKIIGEIKASKSMSFADCCIAGLAQIHKAIIVHKDPEFEQLKDEIKQHRLPYKDV